MFQRKYDEHNLDIDETMVTELLEHDYLRLLSCKILVNSEKRFIPILFIRTFLLKLFISRFEVWR